MKVDRVLMWCAGVVSLATIGMGTALAGGGRGAPCFADWEIECCAISTQVMMNCTGAHCDVNYPPYGLCCVDSVTPNVILHSRTAGQGEDGVDNRHQYECTCSYVDFRCNSTNHVCYAYSEHEMPVTASKAAGYPCIGSGG